MMNRQIKSVLLAASLSLMLTVPAYAHGTAEDGGNGGLGNGMGTMETKTSNGSNYRINEVGTGGNYDVSVYGTSTGSQYWNTNHRIEPDGARTNQYTGYHTNSITGNTDNRLHTTSTTTGRDGGSWGWLGLLGLFGLRGLMGRRTGDERR
ncbi:hypothetical protein P9847_24520 [Paenibacillus chibensis]|uniref:MYXO-CTERM domain-containing protein n=1 Tax=Paenibacillus chibensis TaxID=59846 RepID=A0ABU6PZX4_9BACL|nr:hypothetical protein [Paenibacillus chibensis]